MPANKVKYHHASSFPTLSTFARLSPSIGKDAIEQKDQYSILVISFDSANLKRRLNLLHNKLIGSHK